MLSEDNYREYNLYIWIAYQESWKLEKSDVYFDNYISLVNTEYVLENVPRIKSISDEIDDYGIRLAYLMYKLSKLWFGYKMSLEDYLKLDT
jgi:hypothetical protein